MKNHTVAWCASCNQKVADTEVELDGDGRSCCPSCGRPLPSAGSSPDAASTTVTRAGAVAAGQGATSAVDEDEERIKAPWHFKVLVVGTAGYLVYRLVWVIFWLTGHAWHG
ncbi:MAG TPA: hypothetical protein VMU75_02735 [Acidimicrobiales bacterium]|nr:hypothetical protein [Acidimicrobiales bacterium]